MARRYVRDNRGRFASAGSGATARGGRLRTASGNKRETVKASPGIGDKMSSAPRGTVGKTRSARFSQHVDRPLEKRGAYKQRFNDQRATIANRRAPKEMSKEEFARTTGGKTRADSMGAAIEMSRQPRGRTKAGDRRNEARLRGIQNEVRATDKAYEAAIKSGSIKAPTQSLARKAAGSSDNPAVQAARRLQDKTAQVRARNAAKAAQGSASLSPRTRRIRAEKSKITAYSAKQFRADKTGIGNLTIAEVSSKNWKLPRSMRKK